MHPFVVHTSATTERVKDFFGIPAITLLKEELAQFNGNPGFVLASFDHVGNLISVFDPATVKQSSDDLTMDAAEAGLSWAHETAGEPWMAQYQEGKLMEPRLFVLDNPDVFAGYLKSVSRATEQIVVTQGLFNDD